MKTSALTLQLDLPPSVNTYWRSVPSKGRVMVLLSERGRAYRRHVAHEVMAAGCPRMNGRLSVHIAMFPPDKRRRDLDNVQKALLDALEHAGVYEDDSQVDEIVIRRGELLAHGAVQVFITQIEAAPVALPLPLAERREREEVPF